MSRLVVDMARVIFYHRERFPQNHVPSCKGQEWVLRVPHLLDNQERERGSSDDNQVFEASVAGSSKEYTIFSDLFH